MPEAVLHNWCGTGQFCANVLPQEMAQIADRFAGRMDATLADRFDGVAIQAGACGCPGIVGAVSLYCKVESEHLSGSHLVIIGQVRQIEGSIFRPLTHLDGSYWPWVN